MKKIDEILIVIKAVTLILTAIASLMIVSFVGAVIIHLMGYGI
tara:strand:+ start:8141 stop:8269 length:129 start_codon:yes stop_codon:yes gene_type:complete